MTGIPVQNGFSVIGQALVDLRSGPYATRAAALLAVPISCRAVGLILLITNGDKIDQHQFVGGIADVNLTLLTFGEGLEPEVTALLTSSWEIEANKIVTKAYSFGLSINPVNTPTAASKGVLIVTGSAGGYITLFGQTLKLNDSGDTWIEAVYLPSGRWSFSKNPPLIESEGIVIEDTVFTSANGWTLTNNSGTTIAAIDNTDGVNKLHLKLGDQLPCFASKTIPYTPGDILSVEIVANTVVSVPDGSGNTHSFQMNNGTDSFIEPLSTGLNAFTVDTTGFPTDLVCYLNNTWEAGNEIYITSIKITK